MFQENDVAAIPFKRARPSVAGDVKTIMPVPRRIGRTRVKLRRSDITARGLPGFVAWLQRDFPSAYAALAVRRPRLISNLAGLGFSVASSGGQAEAVSAATANRGRQIADFVLPLLQVYQQRQILKVQLARARAGQPPLDVESLSPPATRIELEAGAKTQRTALWIAGAVGLTGVALFLGRRRARR